MMKYGEAIQRLNQEFFKTTTAPEPSPPTHPTTYPSSAQAVSENEPYIRHFRTSNNPYRPRVIKLPCFSAQKTDHAQASVSGADSHDDSSQQPSLALEQSAAPEASKTKRIRTVKVNKTSRSQRNAEDQQHRKAQALVQGTELQIQERRRGLGQLINDGLKGMCETVTLSKGDTRHLLGTCMTHNLKPAVEAFIAAGQASEFKLYTDDQPSVAPTGVKDESALAREVADDFEKDYTNDARLLLLGFALSWMAPSI
ncbi:hypothetical protein BG004_004441 [Podila humilis]|nr:hypothetical protein BG004_004441 [Podila humilis]